MSEQQSTGTLADLRELVQGTPLGGAGPDGAAAPVREPKRDEFGRSYATGKRKDAVARVWVKPGKGTIEINGKPAARYFARPVLRMLITQPFLVADRYQQFDVFATVSGGGLSFIEYQTHMSIWCMACSPLMIGCDVREMDRETASLLMNREVLAVNQDALGKPARRVKQFGQCEVWKKPLADGSVAVALINRGSTGSDVTLRAGDIGMLDEPNLCIIYGRRKTLQSSTPICANAYSPMRRSC